MKVAKTTNSLLLTLTRVVTGLCFALMGAVGALVVRVSCVAEWLKRGLSGGFWKQFLDQLEKSWVLVLAEVVDRDQRVLVRAVPPRAPPGRAVLAGRLVLRPDIRREIAICDIRDRAYEIR